MIEFAREHSIFEFAVHPINLPVNNAWNEGPDLIEPFVLPSFRRRQSRDTTPNVNSSEEFREGDKKMERPEERIAYESNVITPANPPRLPHKGHSS